MNEADRVTVAGDLANAREIVRTRWYKGGLTDGVNVCAVGAIRESITGLPTVTLSSPWFYRCLAAEAVVQEKLPAEYEGSIAGFNDDSETIHQDVLDLFDKALAELAAIYTAFILPGLLLAPPAQADTVDGYASTHSGVVCEVLDTYPTVAGVTGVVEGVVKDSGFDYYDAGTIVATAVINVCPRYIPLLQRFIAVNSGKVQAA
jgi:hypothetical protein